MGYLSICVRSRGGIADILAREGCRHNVASLPPRSPLDLPPLPPSSPVSPRSRHQGRDPGFDRPPRPAPAAIHALPTACRSNLQCAVCVPSCAKCPQLHTASGYCAPHTNRAECTGKAPRSILCVAYIHHRCTLRPPHDPRNAERIARRWTMSLGCSATMQSCLIMTNWDGRAA